MTRSRGRLLAAALVAVVALLQYAGTLSYGAAWDDTRFVFESGARGGVAAIPELVTSPFLRDLPAGRSPYRPLTAASYALDWSLGGGQASFFHWTNTALHATASVLVLGVLLALGAGLAPAVFGGLVFAVHPVHAEAVANLAGRAELLVAVSLLGATLLHLRGRSIVAVMACFAAGLAAKENAIVLPGLLMALTLLRPEADVAARGNVPTPHRSGGVPGGRAALTRVVRAWPLWSGLVAVAAVYMLARRAVLGTFTTHDVAPFILPLPTGTRVATAVANWTEYVRLMVYPADLVVDYGPAVIQVSTVGDLPFWTGLAVGAGVVFLAAVAWPRTRLPALGVAWFAVAVAPVSNLLVPIAQWLAERFLYLPSVGLSLAVAGGWHVAAVRLRSPGARRAAGALAVAALALLAARTWTRNATWRDTDTVARTLIEEHPEAFRAQWLLGMALLEAGRAEEGLAALTRARDLNPNAIELHLELAGWWLRLGRAEEARAAMEALPLGRHAGRDALLARSLAALGEAEAADSVVALGLAAFPGNPTLSAVRDSLARASAR